MTSDPDVGSRTGPRTPDPDPICCRPWWLRGSGKGGDEVPDKKIPGRGGTGVSGVPVIGYSDIKAQVNATLSLFATSVEISFIATPLSFSIIKVHNLFWVTLYPTIYVGSFLV